LEVVAVRGKKQLRVQTCRPQACTLSSKKFESLRVIFPEACFVARCLGYPVTCCGVSHFWLYLSFLPDLLFKISRPPDRSASALGAKLGSISGTPLCPLPPPSPPPQDGGSLLPAANPGAALTVRIKKANRKIRINFPISAPFVFFSFLKNYPSFVA